MAVTAALLTAAVAGAAPAAADPGRVVVQGHATSEVGPDVRRLTVSAADGGGAVQFTHWAPAGVSRFVALVTCVAESDGAVRMTGEVVRGETAAGVVLTGRDFGMTLDAGSDPQTFSLPRFGAPGTLTPCSGGRPEQVPVTSGRLRVRNY